ncbi:MAG: DUF2520 domain-containing protein [Deltaproteobacteria bacterium]|nr:DUF2520 domain-containing protein [Deltaproteobacteria bacterium]
MTRFPGEHFHSFGTARFPGTFVTRRRPTAALSVVLVGRGRVGRALARSLRNPGSSREPTARSRSVARPARGRALDVTLLPGRALDSPTARRALSSADVVWLAVPDAAIEPTSAAIADLDVIGPRTVVLHSAGALGLDVLAPLASRASLGALHPLVSFADARHPPPLAGTTFVAEGSPASLRAARVLARACGAHLVVAPGLDRALYHAAAALLANGAAALASVSLSLSERAGLGAPSRVRRALAGLLASVASNVATLGPTRALTGPIARGDVASVRRHLAHVDRSAPDASGVYRDVGRAILAVAELRGLDPETRDALATMLATPAER